MKVYAVNDKTLSPFLCLASRSTEIKITFSLDQKLEIPPQRKINQDQPKKIKSKMTWNPPKKPVSTPHIQTLKIIT